jgi:hypothetical protein
VKVELPLATLLKEPVPPLTIFHEPVPSTGVLPPRAPLSNEPQIFCVGPTVAAVGKALTVIVPVAFTVPQPPANGIL